MSCVSEGTSCRVVVENVPMVQGRQLGCISGPEWWGAQNKENMNSSEE